jgi:uncharacterized protein YceH (UPF0502 family)
MGFFGFVFWIIVIWMIIRHMQRRENRRMVGVTGGWYDSGEFYSPRKARKQARKAIGDQQQYIESLETRVSELEERLDFTERLLAGNQRGSGAAGQG